MKHAHVPCDPQPYGVVHDVAIEESAQAQGIAALRRAQEAERARVVTASNARVASAVENAKASLAQRDVAGAERWLAEVAQVRDASNGALANELRDRIARSADPERIRGILTRMSDDEFAEFQRTRKPTRSLDHGFDVLNERAVTVAAAETAAAVGVRTEKKRQANAEAEARRRAHEAKVKAERDVENAKAKAKRDAEEAREKALRDEQETAARAKEPNRRAYIIPSEAQIRWAPFGLPWRQRTALHNFDQTVAQQWVC